MIFLSYNHNDKEIVETVAKRLAVIFGIEKIFFDEWSIQPGDGIINEMNKGLEQARHVLYLVSKSSLQSKFVDLEWQNALVKSVKGDLQLVPVKLDDCIMPSILLQNKYIDMFGKGFEVAIRQVIDVIKGTDVLPDLNQTYENVRAFIVAEGQKITIEVRAMTYMEPQAQFGIICTNQKNDFSAWERGSPIFQSNFENVAKMDDGTDLNALFFERQRALSPGFPYVLEINVQEGKKLNLTAMLHAKGQGSYGSIPYVWLGGVGNY